MTSDVAVVVASRNRREDLLASLPRHEAPVVLVGNGSTDGTVTAVRAAHPQVARLVGSAVRTGRPGIEGLLRALPDVPAALHARRPLPESVRADVRRLAGGG